MATVLTGEQFVKLMGIENISLSLQNMEGFATKRGSNYVLEGNSLKIVRSACFASTNTRFLVSKDDNKFCMGVNTEGALAPNVQTSRIVKSVCDFVNNIEDGLFKMSYYKISHMPIIMVMFEYNVEDDYPYITYKNYDGVLSPYYLGTELICRILRLLTYEFYSNASYLGKGFKHTGRKWIYNVRDMLMCWVYGDSGGYHRAHNIVDFIEYHTSGIHTKKVQKNAWSSGYIRKSYTESRSDVLHRVDLFMEILKAIISRSLFIENNIYKHLSKSGISHQFDHIAKDYLTAKGIKEGIYDCFHYGACRDYTDAYLREHFVKKQQ